MENAFIFEIQKIKIDKKQLLKSKFVLNNINKIKNYKKNQLDLVHIIQYKQNRLFQKILAV